jgi:hypothetical protein
MPDANLAKQVTDRVVERARGVAQQMADRIGQPIDSEGMSRGEVQRLWWMANPQANPQQIQQLIASGQHSQALDLAYPWRNRLIGTGSPSERAKRAESFAQMAMPGDQVT